MMRRMNEQDFVNMMAAITGATPEAIAKEMGFVPATAPVAFKHENHECCNNRNNEHKHPEGVMEFDSMEDFLNALLGGVAPTQDNRNDDIKKNDNDGKMEKNEQENIPTEIKEHYAPIHINCRKVNGNTIVEFELAGFTTKEISVVLEDDAVTVTAVRKVDRQAMSICEIDNAKQRTILIGRGYTVEDFQHTFKNGILTLTFPSVKRNESGRIQIL